MKPKSTLRSFLAATGSALIAISSAASADTLYYKGGGTNTTGLGWGTNTNWTTDLAGTIDATNAPASGDDVIFSITGATAGVVGMNAARAANSLTFSSSVANTLMAHTTTTTANSLTIGAGGVTIDSGAGAVTFGVSNRGTLTTILNASQSWTNNGANAMTVIQPVNLGANALTLTGSGAGNIAITGKISGPGGSVILNRASSSMDLNTTNDFTGGFTLNAGTVTNIGSGLYNGFGTGTLSITGGTLALTAGATPRFNNNANWQGTLTMTRASSGTPVVTWNGAITLTGNMTFTHGAATYGINEMVNGNIGDGGNGYSLTFSGGSTSSKPVYTLNGTNSYTGTTTLNNGTLVMTKPSSIGGVTVTGTQSFIYAPTAAGALNLGGAMTIGSATPIGTALGGTASQSVIAATGAATLAGTGVVNINLIPGTPPAAGTHNLITAASGLTGGTYTLGAVYNNTDFTLSNFTRSATAISVDVTAATPLSGDVYWKGGLAGNTGVWSASNGSTQSNWQVTDGVNQPLAPSANTDLVFSTATSPGTMAGMTLGANMTVRSLTINNTATAFSLNNDALNSTLTITPSLSTTGITLGSGVQAATISAPLALGAAQTWTNNSTNALNIKAAVNNNGNTLTFDGTGSIDFATSGSVAILSGSGGITKNGTGRLVMGANPAPAHTYTGSTILNGGVTMFSVNMGGGNLTLNGGVYEEYWTYDVIRSLGSGVGQIQILGGVSGFSENGGTNMNVKLGNGTATVVWGASGEGSATGFFNPSTLVLQASSAQSGSTLNFQNGIDLNGATRTIQVAKTTSVTSGATVSGAISNSHLTTAAGLTKTGPGILILSAANTFNGTTTISAGVLSLTNASALQNSALDTTSSVAGSATAGLKTNQTTLTLGGLIGNKDFDDTAGSVFTTASGGYSAVTALTLKVGTGNTHSYSGAIGNGAATTSLTKSGDGTQILAGTNTYTGATNVNQGTLLVNGSLDATSNVTVQTTGTLGGTGTINGSVTVAAAGNVAPGASVGTLTIGGGLDISAMAGGAGLMNYELGTNTAASDQIAVTGTLTIGTGALGFTDFAFTNAGGLQNGTYTLITSGGINGGDSLDGADLSGSIGVGGTGTLQINGNSIELVVSGLGGGPGPLDHFAISAISSPQTVGTPITGITLTAQDASNTTVTSFTGTVNFGGTGGFTGTSASFTAGVLSGVSVTPTIAGSNLTFTVTDIGSGKTGSTTITTIQTQYEAWASGAAFDADANGDGVKNGMAFLLGASSPTSTVTLPTVSQSAGDLTLSFSMRNAAARGSASLNVQHSSDLGITDAWASALVPETTQVVSGVTFTITGGSPNNGVVATIPASGNAASGKLFGRLKANP